MCIDICRASNRCQIKSDKMYRYVRQNVKIHDRLPDAKEIDRKWNIMPD